LDELGGTRIRAVTEGAKDFNREERKEHPQRSRRKDLKNRDANYPER
jgi:hypothetical protein